MTNTKILSWATFLIIISYSSQAQKYDAYIAPSAQFITHVQSQMAIHGDLINDAAGGIDYQNGGKIIIYRTPTVSASPSRIYNGPSATTSTGNYNTGAPYLRVYDLVTDNSTNSAVPSGTQINTASGSGDIQVEQEVRISHEHSFVNGIIWTPRDKWQQAYILYEDSATYTGVAANNTAGPHIDGYAAYTGDQDFMFPIGNGVLVRLAGIKSPNTGTYRAAYFLQNPQSGTTGISGTSAAPGPMSGGMFAVSTQEFWDIDGTGSTNITLSAMNSAPNYTNWSTDFIQYQNDPSKEIGITGWDEWQYLGNSTPIMDVNTSGLFTTTIAVHPDSIGTGGNPFSAFTWAVNTATNLALDELHLKVFANECAAQILISTSNEDETDVAKILRTDEKGRTKEIAQIPMKRNTQGEQNYSYTDWDIIPDELYVYQVHVHNLDGSIDKSNTQALKVNCTEPTQWQAYPSPTQDKVYLEVNKDLAISKIKVYDILGHVTQQIYVHGTQRSFEIDLSGQSAGTYMITVFDDEGKSLYSTPVVRVE